MESRVSHVTHVNRWEAKKSTVNCEPQSAWQHIQRLIATVWSMDSES